MDLALAESSAAGGGNGGCAEARGGTCSATWRCGFLPDGARTSPGRAVRAVPLILGAPLMMFDAAGAKSQDQPVGAHRPFATPVAGVRECRAPLLRRDRALTADVDRAQGRQVRRQTSHCRASEPLRRGTTTVRTCPCRGCRSHPLCPRRSCPGSAPGRPIDLRPRQSASTSACRRRGLPWFECG